MLTIVIVYMKYPIRGSDLNSPGAAEDIALIWASKNGHAQTFLVINDFLVLFVRLGPQSK